MERRELASLLGAPPVDRSGASRTIQEGDTAQFMVKFAQAVSDGGNIFLADPAWRTVERSGLGRYIGSEACGEEGWLMIPSGGASGGLKFARHDGGTIAVAVQGFCRHFGIEHVNTVSVLPIHHVSGFMAWMRSEITWGTFIPWEWKDLEAGRFPPDNCEGFCLSLVPTQLQRLLASPEAVRWLRKLRMVSLGAAPAWPALLDEAARLEIPLAPSYGTTETAAMVAALKPEQFLNGMRGSGQPLPHARIDIAEGGLVRIQGESLFRGYFPQLRGNGPWVTGDLGEFDPSGSLVILGRNDDMIVTGGKKVEPVEVEGVLRASGEFEDVAVIGLPDAEWGQAVVACYEPAARKPRDQAVAAALSALASFKHPKRYLEISPWPRNAQGKINRLELARLASQG